MKIIHKYIISEFLDSFIFGLLVFSSILLLDQVFQLVNLLLTKGVSFFIISKLFLFIIPNIFSLTIPMATLFGILLTFGRFSEDNEITALRSSGVTYFNFTMPLIVLAFIFSLFLLYFNQYLSPQTHHQFRNLYQEILSQRPLIKFEENSITNIGDYRLFVQKINKKNNSLSGVNIYKFSQDASESPWRISSNAANVEIYGDSVILNLENGTWQKPNPSRPSNLINLRFSHYKFAIPFPKNVLPFSQSLREMTAKELIGEINKLKANKMPTNFFENEFWLRWVLAFAPFAFAVVAVPLGIISERGGKSIGFGISLLVLFGYYILLVTGLNVGEKGYIRPVYILWLPDICAFICGLALWKRMLKN